MSVTITISPPQSLDDAGQLSRVKGRVMEKKKTENVVIDSRLFTSRD